MAGDKNYLDLLEKMKELHIKKNAGYSGNSQDRWANFRMSESFGVSAVLGCLVRMSDKFIRIQNLITNPKNEQVGEAITDTLMDLASYALITICLLNESTSSKSPYTQGEYYTVEICKCSTDGWWYDDKIGERYKGWWDEASKSFQVRVAGNPYAVDLVDVVVIDDV